MSPGEIVARAKAAGMDGLALTDHQSARNTPAIAECAKRAGIACLFGMEVQTAEEVHTVALFDTVEQALALTDWVYDAMPKRVNDPETFGDQPVVTWDDDIVDLEWRILAMGCRRTIPETAAKVHELGGLYLAAHIDRPNFSVLSALGSIPEPPLCAEPPCGDTSSIVRRATREDPSSIVRRATREASPYFDAVELSRTADAAEWLPRAAGYAVTRSSDAHNLDDVARVWTEADLRNERGEPEFSVAALRAAFAAKATTLSPKLAGFF